jgi:predicted SprT family Zn-dependent metalloprotease
MSRKLTPLRTMDRIRNTILHEIAHALNGPSKAPHGVEWKRIAERIGASPERCSDALRIPGRYIGTCPMCNRSWRGYHRRNRRYCTACLHERCGGVFDERSRLIWSEG